MTAKTSCAALDWAMNSICIKASFVPEVKKAKMPARYFNFNPYFIKFDSKYSFNERVTAVVRWFARAKVPGSCPVWCRGESVVASTTHRECTRKCPSTTTGSRRI